MLPLSYQGFGFTAILLMVAVLSVVEGIKYIKHRLHREPAKAANPEPLEVTRPSERTSDPLS